MNKEAIEIQASELLALGKSLTTKPEVSQAAKLLNGAISLTTICYGPDSTQCSGLIKFRDQFISARRHELSQTMPLAIRFTCGALENLLSELDVGLIGNLQQQIAGEVLGDLIQLAKAVLSEDTPGTVNVAAVLTAASYEDTIRRMGSQLAGITDRPKLETVINKLKEAKHLKGAQVGIAQSYLKFRNDALHADWDDIEKESVNSCLSFVEGLLSKHFS